ncbi:hypothetical protein C8R46DRAFT_1221834 [Mycena filopes]|nr:hypothetical protein C8R46DRAFT_1221834 [Mycena filopes]
MTVRAVVPLGSKIAGWVLERLAQTTVMWDQTNNIALPPSRSTALGLLFPRGHVSLRPQATAAGAGVASVLNQVQASLVALALSVDALTQNAAALVGAPIANMTAALASVQAAASAVQTAGTDVATAVDTLTAIGPASSHQPGTFLRNSAPWVAGYLYSVTPAAPLTAVPDNGGKWFAITRGKYVRLTQNSAISLNAVSGVSTAISQKLGTQALALAHFNGALASGSLGIV